MCYHRFVLTYFEKGNLEHTSIWGQKFKMINTANEIPNFKSYLLLEEL